MNREKAKKMAQSRDCHCIKGKDRDNNYNECIDKIFDYFETNPLEATGYKDLAFCPIINKGVTKMNKDKIMAALALLNSMVLGKEDHTEGSLKIYKEAVYELNNEDKTEYPPLENR